MFGQKLTSVNLDDGDREQVWIVCHAAALPHTRQDVALVLDMLHLRADWVLVVTAVSHQERLSPPLVAVIPDPQCCTACSVADGGYTDPLLRCSSVRPQLWRHALAAVAEAVLDGYAGVAGRCTPMGRYGSPPIER